jgi:LacI family transcriptional regulator
MQPLERLCCQNSACKLYGRRGCGNLSACGWIDRKKTIRQLYCSACKARFSERKGTPLYNAKLPVATVVAILDHVRDGCGVRQTGRLVHVSKNTANRFVRLAGDHARKLHDELVAFSPADAGGPIRREVGLRPKEGSALRPR